MRGRVEVTSPYALCTQEDWDLPPTTSNPLAFKTMSTLKFPAEEKAKVDKVGSMDSLFQCVRDSKISNPGVFLFGPEKHM
jgi:hypothetical protein